MRITVFIVFFNFFIVCSPAPSSDNERLSVRQTMAIVDDSFAKVEGPRSWRFPEDHGPHSAYKSEWWYFTGNLKDKNKREFGYQFTIFRQGIGSGLADVNSVFSAKEVYLLHFVVTDLETNTVYSFENYARSDNNQLAGAKQEQVWIDGSKIEIGPENWLITGIGEDFSLVLDLSAASEMIMQGEQGYSRKGNSQFNASYYYTIPRWQSTGKICLKETNCYQVEGLSWLDREFSTSALDDGQVGWDWFAIQLDTGENIMLYQMRREDGSIDVHSHGYFQSNLLRRPLTIKDYTLEPITFSKQRSGTRVPTKWKIQVLEREFIVQAKQAEHELPFSISYWEGPISVKCADQQCGQGYLEMTGY